MSALGQKQTSEHVRLMSALPPKADIGTQPRDVRFVPIADIAAYSMTSSARESSAGGTVKPSALAVLRLITNSYLVGALHRQVRGLLPLENATWARLFDHLVSDGEERWRDGHVEHRGGLIVDH
jgi:hypothetical protein